MMLDLFLKKRKMMIAICSFEEEMLNVGIHLKMMSGFGINQN